MEAFTIGRVSAAARKAYLQGHALMADAFMPIRGGYRMAAWESQIDMARACGRGWRAGAGQPIHRFDRKPCGCEQSCGHSPRKQES